METQSNNPQTTSETAQIEKIDLTVLIDDMWRGFRRFWYLVLILTLLAGGANTWRTVRSYSPRYEAHATFVVAARNIYGYSQTYYNKTAAEQLGKSFPYILDSGALREVVCKKVGVDQLQETISSSNIADTNLFTIKVSGRDPQRVYEVLQATIESYPTVAEYVIGDTELRIMDDSGLPTAPANPLSLPRAAAKGGILGLAAAMALIVLYAFTRNTVRREEDMKRCTSYPHLGSIPKIEMKRRSKRSNERILLDGENKNEAFAESISGIRGRFLKEAEKLQARTIVVTSTAAGEGKTTTAINLGISLARKGRSVLLIDGDLRNPSVGAALGLKNENSTVLSILKGTPLNKKKAFGYKKLPLYILPGAVSEKTNRKVLYEENIRSMISQASKSYDYVIIDTPPCGIVNDAASFARCADAVLYIVRQDYSSMTRIQECMELISETGTPVMGYIINDATVGITGYGSGYGYGYGYGYGKKYGYGKYGKYGYGKYGKYGHYGYGHYGEAEEDQK